MVSKVFKNSIDINFLDEKNVKKFPNLPHLNEYLDEKDLNEVKKEELNLSSL